jgi:outer membrane protein assembly factor BamA
MFKFSATLIICVLPLCLFCQNPGDMINPPQISKKDTIGQKDLIEVFLDITHIHIKKRARVKGKKMYYSLLPFGTIPRGGTALVTTTQAGFYLGDRKNTYLSNITFSPSTNLQGQFNLPFFSNIWSAANRWNFQGDLRYTYIPQDTWGLGVSHEDDDKLRINYSYVRLYGSALKRIKPCFFAGLGYNLDYQIHIRPDNDTSSIRQFTGYPYGTANRSNSFSSGLSANLLYDTRVNSINPLPGYFANIIFRVNPTFLGSNDPWYSLYADTRKYIQFRKKGQNVLAVWTYLWTTFGSPSPYLNLPVVGWDAQQRSGRGLYNRRYTGTTLWYLETEYRREISKNGLFGFVVFANVNSVTEPDTKQFAYLHPAAGAGLRIKFNKNSATNIGIDFGVSKGYSGIYFNLGEAF